MKFKMIMLFLLVVPKLALANKYALGVMIGAPTGLSGTYDLSENNFLQMGVSGDYSYFDYQQYSDKEIKLENTKWYYGAGVVIKKSLGVRGASGLNYTFDDPDFCAFAEGAFNLFLGGDIKSSLSAAIGARYNFK